MVHSIDSSRGTTQCVTAAVLILWIACLTSLQLCDVLIVAYPSVDLLMVSCFRVGDNDYVNLIVCYRGPYGPGVIETHLKNGSTVKSQRLCPGVDGEQHDCTNSAVTNYIRMVVPKGSGYSGVATHDNWM